MKRLPIGLQTFSHVINDGHVYADKTRYIRDMANQGKFFFLSRPRRFGKSLLVDTMKEAFSGNRDLFEGLDLARSDFDFTTRPVIRLDMSRIDLSDRASLRSGVLYLLSTIAEDENVTMATVNPAIALQDLISRLHRKTGQRVVVLIDEYDRPIIEHLARPELAEENRAELRSLYGVLKGMDADLHFVFLTGVSKFTRTSIFSQLNNLTDISLDQRYANICGFTEQEFDALFSEHLAHVVESHHQHGDPDAGTVSVRDEIFTWYDGYSWDGIARVFNPFSLLKFFDAQEFYPYWYTSGVPQFLARHLKDNPCVYTDLENTEITEVLLDSHDIEQASLESLLFQTGFLTVKSADRLQRPTSYRLGFPNLEVSQSFSGWFLDTVGDDPATVQTMTARLRKALNEGHPEDLEECLAGLFAAIPYTRLSREENELARYPETIEGVDWWNQEHNLHLKAEAFYHAILLAVLRTLGFRVTGEQSAIDATIDTVTGQSYVVEMKYVALDAGADPAEALGRATAEALDQIAARHYADRYRGSTRSVHLVGIAVAGHGHVRVATS